jgi:AcrR family transcriptional regulator
MAMRDELNSFKKERILEEAATLFYERGFRGTSVDAIAERLSVTKPFVYQHYRNKAALLKEIYIRVVQQSLACVCGARASPGTPRERLRRFVSDYTRLVIAEQRVTAIFFREENNLGDDCKDRINALKGDFDDELSALLQEGVDCGEFTIGDVRMTTLAIVGMISWLYTWYRSDGRLDPDGIVERMLDCTERMVGVGGRGDPA